MAWVSDEERAVALREKRISNVSAWLGEIEDNLRSLEDLVLSRDQEHAGQAGVDPDPRLRPCEHRSEWQRSRLCLACDNTGLRPATEKERAEGLAYDPYLLDPPRDNYAVSRDQSYASQKSHELALLDASIESLERDARLREGTDVRESGDVRTFRQVEAIERQLGRTGRKVLFALAQLKHLDAGLYRRALQREHDGLATLANLVPGSLRLPPNVVV